MDGGRRRENAPDSVPASFWIYPAPQQNSSSMVCNVANNKSDTEEVTTVEDSNDFEEQEEGENTDRVNVDQVIAAKTLPKLTLGISEEAHFINISNSVQVINSPWIKDMTIQQQGAKNTVAVLESMKSPDKSPVNREIAKRVARYRSLDQIVEMEAKPQRTTSL